MLPFLDPDLPRIHVEALLGKLRRHHGPARKLASRKGLDSALRRLRVLVLDVDLADTKAGAGTCRTRDFGLDDRAVFLAFFFDVFLDFCFVVRVSYPREREGERACGVELPSYSSSLINSSEVTMFMRQTTRLCSRLAVASALASMEMAPTPPSRPAVCCTPTVARETLRLPSPRVMSLRPSMTASTTSLSAYSQNAIP